MSLADSGSELVANPSLGTGAVFAIDLIGTALPGVQATVIRRGGEVLLKAVDGTVYKVVGKSADEILKIIGDTSVGKTTIKLADDVLEKLSSVINKVDSKIDSALGIAGKNADSSVTKVVIKENGVLDNGTKYIVVDASSDKIKNIDELLTKEGQIKLKNSSMEEIQSLFEK